MARVNASTWHWVQLKTTVSDRYLVSTVFLDVCPAPGGQRYETMVFASRNGEVVDWTELDVERYFTADAAVAGHAEMVQRWEGVS